MSLEFISDPEMEWDNPLVLASIATISLGASLITYQNVGTMASWAVGTPAAISFGFILPYAIRGSIFVARTAYEDILELFSANRDAKGGKHER